MVSEAAIMDEGRVQFENSLTGLENLVDVEFPGFIILTAPINSIRRNILHMPVLEQRSATINENDVQVLNTEIRRQEELLRKNVIPEIPPEAPEMRGIEFVLNKEIVLQDGKLSVRKTNGEKKELTA